MCTLTNQCFPRHVISLLTKNRLLYFVLNNFPRHKLNRIKGDGFINNSTSVRGDFRFIF